MLNVIPRGTTTPATLYLMLFTGATASTVPATTATSNPASGYTEATGTAYARQSLAAGTWGATAQVSGPVGQSTTYPQVTFPTVGASPWGTVNGFGIFTQATSATAGDTPIFFANFSDTTAIVTATNDVIKLTPTWQLNY
jgi:hypothetical protein